LLQGAYDEAASHQEFLDALNAWRTGSTAPPPKRSQPAPQRVSVSSTDLNLEISQVR